MPAKSASPTAGREIVNTRVFDAPRADVWNAWTDPEILARWWGPKGFTNTFHELDLRPQGHWRFVMHGPDGTDYKNHSVFVELAPLERFVIDHISGHFFRLAAAFEDAGGGTRVIFRMIFDTPEERDRIAVFAGDANEQNFDRLGAELAKMDKNP